MKSITRDEKMTVYFDNAATTRVCPEAAAIAFRAMTENFGNPSSMHRLGREARKILETARGHVADALDAEPDEVFFTSCGTESDNLAILSGFELMRRKGSHIITTAIEHSAVLNPLKKLEQSGADVTYLKPDESGAVPVAAFEKALRPDTVLISVMMVNNETGAVNDVRGISEVLKAFGSKAILHTDAVQAFCKLPFSARTLGADMITVSGHKIHAPKGSGALWARKNLRLKPILSGGGQENGLRSGTEAVPSIAGFGEAARIGKARLCETETRLSELRDYVLSRLNDEVPGVVNISGGMPGILSISLPGYKSEVLMSCLDAGGICVSKSSACKKGGRSYVLEAMGLSPRVVDGTIRISFCRDNTRDEAEHFIRILREAARRLRT